jgi:hypothetical protein
MSDARIIFISCTPEEAATLDRRWIAQARDRERTIREKGKHGREVRRTRAKLMRATETLKAFYAGFPI